MSEETISRRVWRLSFSGRPKAEFLKPAEKADTVLVRARAEARSVL